LPYGAFPPPPPQAHSNPELKEGISAEDEYDPTDIQKSKSELKLTDQEKVLRS